MTIGVELAIPRVYAVCNQHAATLFSDNPQLSVIWATFLNDCGDECRFVE